jgi:ERCC4-type nuclease
MQVKIDSREQDRVKSASAYFKGQGLEVEVCELEIGDYLFDNKVCFEFKVISDFITSIQDHRVFNQAINMAENFDYHFVMIYGSDVERAKQIAISRNYREVTYFQYLGAIASLNRYTTVIESYSPLINESYYRMLITAKKALQNKPIVKKFPKKHKNVCFNWLCYCNYGINAKKADLIVKELNLKTLSDLQELTIEKLTNIKGIGESTAQKIIEGIK